MTKLVAVYGTLRKGLHNDKILRNSKYLGTTTLQPKYKMADAHWYPVVYKSNFDELESDHVVIEVYRIDNETLKVIDVLEGVPDLYKRIKVDTEYGKAYMYVMDASACVGMERIREFDEDSRVYVSDYKKFCEPTF